jgi:hypothetical protein
MMNLWNLSLRKDVKSYELQISIPKSQDLENIT